MNRTTTRALLTAAAVGTALALAQAPASAAPRDESGWVRAQDFGSFYFCQAAGMAGQFAGRWLPGQWQCVGAVLYLRDDPLVVFN